MLALALLAGCTSQEARDRRLVRFLDEVVFGGPFDAHHTQDKLLARWEGAMRVEITGPGAEDYRAVLAEQIAEMAALAGIDARMAVAGDGEPNVVVELVKQSDFLINREYVDCYVRLEGEENRIERAEVYIGAGQSGEFERCLAHEFMHVFGLRFHSGIVRSALSPAHDEEQLTEWDRLALEVLFDPRLELGALREQVLPVIRVMVVERSAGK